MESDCILAYVRSATPGQAVDLSNCQPFVRDALSFVHNGAIDNFRHSLYRPLRDRLNDALYQSILGSTDSEHIFALFQQVRQEREPGNSAIAPSLQATLAELRELAQQHEVRLSANLVLSDGESLTASRFAANTPAPTLYWLHDDPAFPGAVLVASEPLFAGNWQPFPEDCILHVRRERESLRLDWLDVPHPQPTTPVS